MCRGHSHIWASQVMHMVGMPEQPAIIVEPESGITLKDMDGGTLTLKSCMLLVLPRSTLVSWRASTQRATGEQSTYVSYMVSIEPIGTDMVEVTSTPSS